MYNEKIVFYAKNPVNKWKIDDFDIEYHEENRTCWDELTIYLKIKDNIVKHWSFEWDISVITTACASIFWESIIWKEITQVLTLKYDYIEDLIWMPISHRRKAASVLWILTTRNAIHLYLKDWIKNNLEDLIK